MDYTEVIKKYLPEKTGLQKTVFCAMNDAVLAGGKRIRPRLMYETYELFCRKNGKQPDTDEIGPYMAAMETMHSASLIHDDLPCMDNDTLRRGQPTTWVTYGVDMATLAGDAMMIETFSLASKAALEGPDKERGLRAVNCLAVKSGIYGMTGGQVVDVENTGKPLDKEKLDFIYRLKTGALLEGSMMVGAILGGADDEEIDIVEKIASNVGMAFQIKDDILDVTSDAEKLGKPINSDAENDKTTYVTLYGIDKAQEEVVARSEEAISLLDKIGAGGSAIETTIRYLITRDK